MLLAENFTMKVYFCPIKAKICGGKLCLL
uniref:Uncharacterized protein n=1 Tax=Arundo donax TaxID=35708 RepID=A0A0A9FGD4_ARUDO